MNIEELTQKTKQDSANRTPEERFELLVQSKILTRKGHFHPKFFSKETVEKSKIAKKHQ